MPVLPLVGSMITVPGLILPSRSAASIIDLAIRSLTLHSAFMFSSLPAIVATHPSETFRNKTSGVLPMHWVMLFLMQAGSLVSGMWASVKWANWGAATRLILGPPALRCHSDHAASRGGDRTYGGSISKSVE